MIHNQNDLLTKTQFIYHGKPNQYLVAVTVTGHATVEVHEDDVAPAFLRNFSESY